MNRWIFPLGFTLAVLGHGAEPLVWKTEEGYRVAMVKVLPSVRQGFTAIPAATVGIDFTNTVSLRSVLLNINLMNGSGLAAGDFDNDGFCDLYFCSIDGPNALYRNLGGWRFEEVTARAGVACVGMASTGAVFSDVNGDGRLDLLVTSCGGPNALFLNAGEGRFQDGTAAAGLVSRAGSTTMALADVDGDGDLDLYVANYGENSVLRSGGQVAFRMVNGRPVVTGRHARRIKIIQGVLHELGEPDILYLNDGTGRFEPASWTDGRFLDENGQPLKEEYWDSGLTAMFRDLNQDGQPDLYVCNDFGGADRIWINDGQGRFRAIAPLAMRVQSQFSMNVDFADLNRDGWTDFFTTDMLSRSHQRFMTQMRAPEPPLEISRDQADRPQQQRNCLFVNRGNGTFTEIAYYAGLAASEWTWSALFLDVDLDGYEDLLVGNGNAYDTLDLDAVESVRSDGPRSQAESRQNILRYPPLPVANLAFRNLKNLKFDEVGAAWGFDQTATSQGMALADLDNDGDSDILINAYNHAPLLYRNESAAPRVAVRLKGRRLNPQGIGAVITLRGGAVPVQSQEIIAGGRYLSGDDPHRCFAAGSGERKMTLEVRWRSGAQSVIHGILANHVYEIHEPDPPARPAPVVSRPPSATVFKDVSAALSHVHHDQPFNDFERQPLLPRSLSQEGPALAWFDLDGDGHEELIVGSGRGGRLAVFHRQPDGAYRSEQSAGTQVPLPADTAGIVGWTDPTGRRAVLVGVTDYETGGTPPAAVWQFDVVDGGLAEPKSLGALACSPGPLAVADIDGDNDLDLFVGGRMISGRYPEPASSFLYRAQENRLVLDAESSRTWDAVGLVRGAVFTDLTGDGAPELVLACEWGPIRVYHNVNGRFLDHTAAMGLDRYVGWWTGVAAGDLDGDGQMDLVAGNWGENTPYTRTRTSSWRLYYGDLNGLGMVDLIEAYDPPEIAGPAPFRSLLEIAGGLPGLRQRVKSHQAYAQLSIADLVGEQLAHLRELTANTLSTTAFLQRDGRFRAQPLPAQAQWAPASGITVNDVDGDGIEDIVIAQNFFPSRSEDGRFDAGCGLLLRGLGDARYQAVPAGESGIEVYGDQRALVHADPDHDGRIDIVLTQNRSATRLYHNAGAQPGLRVILKGPQGNPDAIGACLRLKAVDQWGPIREVQAGSGYWSQSSLVQVLGSSDPATALWIRWPGGREEVYTVPPEAREVIVDTRSGLEQVR